MCKRLVLGFCAMVGLDQSASAQDCRYSSLIIAMADHRIADRLPTQFDVDNFHIAWAAYYKIHYDSLAGEEVETLLDRIAQQTTDDTAIAQLRAMYALCKPGGLAAWARERNATLT